MRESASIELMAIKLNIFVQVANVISYFSFEVLYERLWFQRDADYRLFS